MYSTILSLHHYISFLALILLLVAAVNGFLGTREEKIFNNTFRKINLFTLISVHTMFLLGVILLVISPVATAAFADMGAAMKDGATRKAIIEHPFTNVLAVILATIGNAKSKKAISHGSKFKASMIYFGLALILILSRLPYDRIFN